jgi:hypothetical protein
VPEIVRIKRRKHRGAEIWTGWTQGPTDPAVDGNSNVIDDFRTASFKIAGVAAEMLFDGENFRLGSSLDEVLAVKVAAANIATKTRRDPGDVCAEIFVRTGRKLKAYTPIVLAIADELRRYEVIRLRRLEAHLRPILQQEKPGSTPWGAPRDQGTEPEGRR